MFLRDKEVACREKDTEIRDLKEKVMIKLPRAMRSAAPNGGILLRERNADQAEESVNKEVVLLPTRRSPARPKRKSDEKENYGH